MLFDKVQNGSEELNSLTGQWFASTPFYLIRTEIDFAAQELGSVVGSEVVEAAEKAYLGGTDPDLWMRCGFPWRSGRLHAMLSFRA